MILMGKLIEKLQPEKYSVMQWHMQAVNVTTNITVKIDFTLPAISTTNVVTRKCQMGDPPKGRYNMILGRDL